MLTRDAVSAEKLRGGFYSPDVLVDLCIQRAHALLGGRSGLRVLEPCAGDGAFLRGLERCGFARHVEHVEAVEIIGEEAEKVSRVIKTLGLPGRAVNENVLRWAEAAASEYDALLANPPYVRFQFISEEDKRRARAISAALGAAGSAVSNLWIPVMLLSLSKLREGGVFSVILPTEFLTGISANSVRNWLLQNTTDLSIDLFQPGSFPSVLQEVLILTGRTRSGSSGTAARIDFYDHNGGTRSWSHNVVPGPGTWTNYLLSPTQNASLSAARSLVEIKQLGDVARFTVSTVTGANGYFCISAQQREEFGLAEWAVPLLARTRHAEGLIFGAEDQQKASEEGHPAWLLDFSADRSSPENQAGPSRYIALGLEQDIQSRFKCRIRSPWYRVPVVPAGELLMSKRSNHFPRVVANHARAVTTDTIYRGQILAGASITAEDFTATFHNSLTLLSAEVEGRSFGGGVLELVPSEVNALRVPVIRGAGSLLAHLDSVCRDSTNPEALVEATDQALMSLLPALDAQIMEGLAEARNSLMERRFQRTRASFYSAATLAAEEPR